MGRESAKPGSLNAASTICPTCGKEFWYYLSWPRTYCSNVCKGKAHIGNIRGFRESRYTATCQQCGKAFETTPGRNRGRFCSHICHGRWLSTNSVGSAHPNTGRKFGRPPYLPPPTMRECPICGKTFAIKPSATKRRRFCSKQCQAAWLAVASRGEANFNWQGGYEPYYGPSWREAQRVVRMRDKVCQLCGMTPEQNGRELDVHHIKPFRTFGITRHKEANDLLNLMLLCHDCHPKYEQATNRML